MFWYATGTVDVQRATWATRSGYTDHGKLPVDAGQDLPWIIAEYAQGARVDAARSRAAGVCLAGAPDDVWERVGYVPSMVYFGVRQREAVWLRMVGVPRVVAEGLGTLWHDEGRSEPESFAEIRGWVSDLDDAKWRKSLPSGSKLTTDDMKWLWREFAG